MFAQRDSVKRYHSVVRGSRVCVWERVFHPLTGARDNDYPIDRQFDRASVWASRNGRGDLVTRLWRASEWLTSKWHIAIDTSGRPVRVILAGGNANDARLVIPLLTGLVARHVSACPGNVRSIQPSASFGTVSSA